MAVLFLDGFDHYANTDTLLKYTSGTNFGNMQTGLLGVGQAARVISSNGPKKTLSSTYATFIHGFRFRASSIVNQQLFTYIDGSGNVVASLNLLSSGAIAWYRGSTGTQVAASSAALISANAINYIEVKVTLSTTTSGTIQVRINGTDAIPSTGSVQTANTSAVMGSFQFQGQTSFDFDDMYLFDTTGSQNNDFAGDCKIITVMPSGAGRVTQWTANGAASDWQCVNQTTPDGDTTYVSSSTVGQIDAYTLTSAGSPTAVKCVQINTDARKDDAGTRTIAHGVGNGTTENFDAGTNVGSSYAYLIRALDTNPLTSAAWTTSDLSTLQSAIKVIA